jgi:hypothetical protein
VLLACATGLKPQIGLCFLFYFLLRRHWRSFGIASVFLLGLSAAGLLQLGLRHTPWLANYELDNRILLETGVLGNFTAINPTRFGLVNLQVALYPLLGRIDLTNDIAWLLGAILGLGWLFAFRKHRDDGELLDLSALVVISLLPIYHRFYDATLLVLPVSWLFVHYRRTGRVAVPCGLLLLPFLVPGGTLLEAMEAKQKIPQTCVHSWWWESFIMAHEVWLLVFLGILLIYQMSKCREQTSDATLPSH